MSRVSDKERLNWPKPGKSDQPVLVSTDKTETLDFEHTGIDAELVPTIDSNGLEVRNCVHSPSNTVSDC